MNFHRFYRIISVLAPKVVKNAFSWNIQNHTFSMQIIYQHKLSVNFDWNFYKKAQLGKRKCQNAELENKSPTKRVFLPKSDPTFCHINFLISFRAYSRLFIRFWLGGHIIARTLRQLFLKNLHDSSMRTLPHCFELHFAIKWTLWTFRPPKT